MEKKVIDQCADCKAPVLFTFKFSGSEYWCPKCGATYGSGMFTGGASGTDAVNATPHRIKTYEAWKVKAKPYLTGETDEWKYGTTNTN